MNPEQYRLRHQTNQEKREAERNGYDVLCYPCIGHDDDQVCKQCTLELGPCHGAIWERVTQ